MEHTNAQQIDYWNGNAGAIWAKRQERMDALLAPISEATLKACSVKRGDRVLDIGCGCGETSLRLAQRGATVLGVDISKPMLARAEERARMEDASAAFVLGDAAVTRFERVYDQVFSRFGVMFFSDPTAAFANIRTRAARRRRTVFRLLAGAATQQLDLRTVLRRATDAACRNPPRNHVRRVRSHLRMPTTCATSWVEPDSEIYVSIR